MNEKLCKQCRVTKTINNFYENPECKDGFQTVCKVCSKWNARQCQINDRNSHKRSNAKWYKKNRIRSLKKNKEWVERNRKRKNAHTNARSKHVRLATPNWLTSFQRQEIVNFYENCPKGYHVDHIYPLRGKTFSGLHVPWNLQYLTIKENLKKHNLLSDLRR